MTFLAFDDPQPGDKVRKGKKTREVTKRAGYDITYLTETGKERECWLTTWQGWCRGAELVCQAAKKAEVPS